eukprot:GFUD01090235.1.p1 GENE.GFUD01090235.1~~GFUD01090235.1.p1  ORF type:complete len:198 (+),score=36.46 GFUD01090235.1:63-656(+)
MEEDLKTTMRCHKVRNVTILEFSSLTSCCFCFNLKTGSVIIGLVGLATSLAILFSLMPAILGYYVIHINNANDFLILLIVSSLAGTSFLYALFSCVLLIGLYRNSITLLSSWMVCQMFSILIQIVMTVLTCIVISKYFLLVVFVSSLLTSFFFHFYGVVKEYKATLKKETAAADTESKPVRRCSNHYSMRDLIKEKS